MFSFTDGDEYSIDFELSAVQSKGEIRFFASVFDRRVNDNTKRANARSQRTDDVTASTLGRPTIWNQLEQRVPLRCVRAAPDVPRPRRAAIDVGGRTVDCPVEHFVWKTLWNVYWIRDKSYTNTERFFCFFFFKSHCRNTIYNHVGLRSGLLVKSHRRFRYSLNTNMLSR